MLAPVVIFVYARPEHTSKTIEALAKNYLANKTEVFIYSDAPKDKKFVEPVNRVGSISRLCQIENFLNQYKSLKLKKIKVLQIL